MPGVRVRGLRLGTCRRGRHRMAGVRIVFFRCLSGRCARVMVGVRIVRGRRWFLLRCRGHDMAGVGIRLRRGVGLGRRGVAFVLGERGRAEGEAGGPEGQSEQTAAH